MRCPSPRTLYLPYPLSAGRAEPSSPPCDLHPYINSGYNPATDRSSEICQIQPCCSYCYKESVHTHKNLNVKISVQDLTLGNWKLWQFESLRYFSRLMCTTGRRTHCATDITKKVNVNMQKMQTDIKSGGESMHNTRSADLAAVQIQSSFSQYFHILLKFHRQ